MSAFKSNKGLYAYKQVKPIDGLIARILVEILISAVISLNIYSCSHLYGEGH